MKRQGASFSTDTDVGIHIMESQMIPAGLAVVAQPIEKRMAENRLDGFGFLRLSLAQVRNKERQSMTSNIPPFILQSRDMLFSLQLRDNGYDVDLIATEYCADKDAVVWGEMNDWQIVECFEWLARWIEKRRAQKGGEMKLIVCGGRDFAKRDFVFDRLTRIHSLWNVTEVLQGGATGVDALAKEWAEQRGIPCTTVPANSEMTKMGDLCAVFPGGKGTADMHTKARKAALHVFVYIEPTEG